MLSFPRLTPALCPQRSEAGERDRGKREGSGTDSHPFTDGNCVPRVRALLGKLSHSIRTHQAERESWPVMWPLKITGQRGKLCCAR